MNDGRRCWLCSHRSWRNPLRPPSKLRRAPAVFRSGPFSVGRLTRNHGRCSLSMNYRRPLSLSRNNSWLGLGVSYSVVASLSWNEHIAAPRWSFHVVIRKHPTWSLIRWFSMKRREPGIADNRPYRRRRRRMKSWRRIAQSRTSPPPMPFARLPHPSAPVHKDPLTVTIRHPPPWIG
jgi:hypothetical protein